MSVSQGFRKYLHNTSWMFVDRVVRLGSQFTTAEAYAYDKDGALVASGRGTYFTAPPK